MFNYDTIRDAHKHSNHREANVIRRVEVDLSVVGVTPETVSILLECIQKGRDFVLYNDEDFVAFCPKYLAQYHRQTELSTIYSDRTQMINAIKLMMLTLTEIEVVDLQIESRLNPKLITHD